MSSECGALALRLMGMRYLHHLFALVLVGCGGSFEAAIPDADAGHDAPDRAIRHDSGASEGGADAGAAREGGRPRHDSGGGDALPDVEQPPDAPVPADAPLSDVAPPPDAGGEAMVGDSGCAPPILTSGSCGGIPYTIPAEFCVYVDSYYSGPYYAVYPTPAACTCATTYNCTCLGYASSDSCGTGSVAGCSGSPPQVTCN